VRFEKTYEIGDDPPAPMSWAEWRPNYQDHSLGRPTYPFGLARSDRFLTGYDAWLTPTMSTPPLPLGEITSTPDHPMRALENGGRTVGYPAVVANITGNPAMSVPLWWNADGLPIGVHFLGRYGDEATLFRLAGQLETARPWRDKTPPPISGG